MTLQRSVEIDTLLEGDSKWRRQHQILVLGAEDSGKEDVWLGLEKLGKESRVGSTSPSSSGSHSSSNPAVREALIENRGRTNRFITLDLPSGSPSQTQKFFKKWMHHFDRATTVVFVVELPYYDNLADQESPPILGLQSDPIEEGMNPTTTKIDESLAIFSIIVNAPWFRRCSIMLFFVNKQQLAITPTSQVNHPLQDFCPYYTDGDKVKVKLAVKLLIAKFRKQMDPDSCQGFCAFYLGNVDVIEGIDMTKLRSTVAIITEIRFQCSLSCE